jgi:hypothetical protein
MTSIKDKIRVAVAEAEEREEGWRRSREEQEDWFRRLRLERDEFLRYCIPATVDNYAAWLRGYLTRGGDIKHVYNYPFPAGSDPSWFVLYERPKRVPSLYGATSIEVIVPSDVDFGPVDVPNTFHGGCGHSTFYFLNGYQIVGDFVPLYSDVRKLLEKETE